MGSQRQIALNTRRMLAICCALIAVAGALIVIRAGNVAGRLQEALEWIRDLGPWAPAAFVALYLVTVVICLPAMILTVGGGFIFGLGWGTAYVLLGATIAGNCTFLLGRYFARDWISKKVQSQPRLKALDDAVAREGWKIVALVRLAPVFPFSLTSYAFGITRIPLRHFFLANFAMIPGVLMSVYVGTILGDLTQRVTRPPWIKWTAGILTLIVVFYLARFARRALKSKLQDGP